MPHCGEPLLLSNLVYALALAWGQRMQFAQLKRRDFITLVGGAFILSVSILSARERQLRQTSTAESELMLKRSCAPLHVVPMRQGKGKLVLHCGFDKKRTDCCKNPTDCGGKLLSPATLPRPKTPEPKMTLSTQSRGKVGQPPR
jgi:hypothetical protein